MPTWQICLKCEYHFLTASMENNIQVVDISSPHSQRLCFALWPHCHILCMILHTNSTPCCKLKRLMLRHLLFSTMENCQEQRGILSWPRAQLLCLLVVTVCVCVCVIVRGFSLPSCFSCSVILLMDVWNCPKHAQNICSSDGWLSSFIYELTLEEQSESFWVKCLPFLKSCSLRP